MKTAEEVAEEIYAELCKRSSSLNEIEWEDQGHYIIAQALTAYAEEKYQQGRDISLLEDRHRIRVDALEEAMKVCDRWKPKPVLGQHGRGQDITAHGIQNDIRALKEKP
jgi:hypothetical protein